VGVVGHGALERDLIPCGLLRADPRDVTVGFGAGASSVDVSAISSVAFAGALAAAAFVPLSDDLLSSPTMMPRMMRPTKPIATHFKTFFMREIPSSRRLNAF
jgi:hypothetical protein